MAGKALYLGPRLKRLRRDLGLTQAKMAADLEISPSYVALMERNQRPVTAELLLSLAGTYGIDIASLARPDGDDLEKRLAAAAREPILADIDLTPLDIADIAASYPNLAEGFLRLRQALSETELLLAARRSDEDEEGGRSDPSAEVRAFLVSRGNAFPALEEAATAIAEAGCSLEDLVARLRERHGLETRFAPPEVMAGTRRFHDYHRRRIMVNDRLARTSRRFQLATQIAILELGEPIEAHLASGALNSENGRILARAHLRAYAGAAIVMPPRPFARAAHDLRYDLDRLCARFEASFEQVAHRLTTLAGNEGRSDDIAFFMVRIDRAGNVSKQLDAAGFPFARQGDACPWWNLFGAFADPGRIGAQRLELPDGRQFLSLARTVDAGDAGGEARDRRAIALVCDWRHAERVVHADGLQGESPTGIGIACRYCHRPHCVARSALPLGRELWADSFRQSATPFAFADR